jgi:hypothetical protein
MPCEYLIDHEHVKSVQLLKCRTRAFRLNDGPFRFAHCLAFLAYAYAVLTYVPPPEPEALASNSTLPETDSFEEFDSTVVDAGLAKEAEDGPPPLEMWEPKTPQDHVRVVWAIITVLHVLTNLFCIWVVKVKRFCQYSTVRSVEAADHVFCQPHQNHGLPDIVHVVKRKLVLPSQAEPVRSRSACPVCLHPCNARPAHTCLCWQCPHT